MHNLILEVFTGLEDSTNSADCNCWSAAAKASLSLAMYNARFRLLLGSGGQVMVVVCTKRNGGGHEVENKETGLLSGVLSAMVLAWFWAR